MDATPALAADRKRAARLRLAAFAAVMFVAIFGIGEFARWVLGSVTDESWWAIDFQLVLDAGARLAAGEPLYADPKFLYPPLAAVLAVPLQGFDPFLLSLAYLAFKVALALIAVAWLTRERSMGDRVLAAIALLLSLPFLHDAMLGNANAILVAAAAMAAFARPTWRSGIALGLAAAVFAKPLLIPIGLWMLVHRRPALAGTIGAGLAATAVGVLVAGPAAYLDWIQALVAGGRFAAPFEGNHGVTAIAPALWLPVAAVVAVGLLVVLWRRGEGTALTWAVTSGILLAPYAGTYSALPIALAIPFLGAVSAPFAIAIVALSPIATGYALPFYAGAILVGALLLRPDGPALPRPLARTPAPRAPTPGGRSHFVRVGDTGARCYRAPAVRIPVTLYLVALVVRLAVAAGSPDPAYADSAYYVQAARELAAGHGLSIDYIWIFADVGGRIPADPVLPIPSFAHWLPVASLVQVPFIWLLGPTITASVLPMALIGALLAPIAWFIARDAGLRPMVGIAAGLLAAVPLLSTPFMSQPESLPLFGPIASAALLFGGRGVRGSARAMLLAGLLAGLAAFTRTEGWLVLGAILVAWGGAWARGRLAHGTGPRTAPVAAAVGAGLLCVLVVAPWYLRQLSEFGMLSPSTATGKVLYLREFSEWNNITTPATLERLLDMGIGPLLMTRLGGFAASLQLFTVLILGFVLVPFLVIGAIRRRAERSLWPGYLYALFLLAFCTLVSAVHVPGGQFIHAAVALIPLAYVVSMEGAVVAAGWLGSRVKARRPERLTAILVWGLVAVGLFSAALSVRDVEGLWAERADRYRAAAAGLEAAGAVTTDRVMSTDAGRTRYWAGLGGVVLTNDPVETSEAVARAYGIRWLLLDHADGVPLARAVLDGQAPSWVGPATWDDGRMVLYPVCTSGGDTRCEAGSS